MKLSKVIELYWLDKTLEMSPKTVATYKYTFHHLVDSTGDKDIEEITYSDIVDFTTYLQTARKQSSRTINDSLARIASLWNWASVEFSVPHIFAKKRPKIKYVETVVEPFLQDEVKKLIDATSIIKYKARGKSSTYQRATALLDRALILTLLDSGARASELCALEIRDYNEENGQLLIRQGKGNKSRFVIIGNRTRRAIFKYLTNRKNVQPSDPLFSTRGGKPFDRNNLRHKLTSIAKVAGVSNVHPHRFRHTFAISYLRNGGNVLVLQALLGHESLEMVQHYAKIAEVDLQKARKHLPSDNWNL